MSEHLESEQFTLLYILGSGHYGSTLLHMLLNGHPSIRSLGEAHCLYGSRLRRIGIIALRKLCGGHLEVAADTPLGATRYELSLVARLDASTS